MLDISACIQDTIISAVQGLQQVILPLYRQNQAAQALLDSFRCPISHVKKFKRTLLRACAEKLTFCGSLWHGALESDLVMHIKEMFRLCMLASVQLLVYSDHFARRT